ncbi:MAG: prepilin peptidase [Phycisphaerales bacterium]|nr:prepilin peptidase [Phycisphaerales bacterium]
MIGLACSIILLRTGLIRRSFTDYEEWERKARESMGDGAPEANTPELWVQYPHARREMLKEIAFLGPVILLGWLGATLAVSLGGSGLSATEVPLWLRAISGSILGYLVGGGIVWGLRIFGSLAFGKEAMGLGDAHLLAAVGACIGWIDSLFAFFAAAFLGIGWELSRRLFSERFRRMLPYGPFLAGGAVLVLLCKPLIELGMTLLLRVPAHQPPINIP